jgi:Dna[CI] antecedent, DciA
VRKRTDRATYAGRTAPAPLARPVGQVLESTPSLAGLLGGHRRAQACYARVAHLLPPPLGTQVRPGPIDGGVWTLFAAHGGAAAKLRQALPTLLAAVAHEDPPITEIRVKVLPPAAP